jgi:hypothetical protein
LARTRVQRQLYAELLERYGRAVADAFFKAIDDIRKAASLQAVTAAIEAGDIEGALDALDIDPAAFNDMLDRIKDAQTAGGNYSTETMPKRRPDGTAFTVRWDGRAVEAESWMRQHAADLVTHTTQDMREAARQSLVASLERGDNPKRAGLELVGRINRVTGKRTGGTLGLSVPQEEYVRRAREELASTSPDFMSNYLGRKRRDRRFDRSVAKAIREGKPVPPEIAAKAITAYSNRLLQLRGETIGRHEAFAALSAGRQQAYEQAVASGKITAAAVTKSWRHLSSLDYRPDHRLMNGKGVGLMESFVLPDGTTMLYPHDSSAPIKHTVGCRCQADYKVDFLAGIR